VPSRSHLVALLGVALPLAPARLGAQEGRITPTRVAEIVGVLAHDSMRGRATPSAELELTATWVAAQLERAGAQPAGEDGGFLQRFPVRGDTTAPNVVGVVPGREPRLAGEYVLVVAHMDHVGVGGAENGDVIYNGADDNASGTAGLIVLAEALATMQPRLRRSVLFLVTSGEERGLLGARWFASHPTVALDSAVALINLDMIGRNTPDSVYLNGWGKSTVADEVVRQARRHPELGLTVGPDLEDRPLTPADSDHWPFQRRGIPYAFFYTGPHADYHRPGDAPECLDADKAARVARLAAYTVIALADADRRPRWEKAARRLNVPDGR
jgi:Zn-dependent M28 family amino/carboxypeptidase